jgi:hypothetical protein
MLFKQFDRVIPEAFQEIREFAFVADIDPELINRRVGGIKRGNQQNGEDGEKGNDSDPRSPLTLLTSQSIQRNLRPPI